MQERLIYMVFEEIGYKQYLPVHAYTDEDEARNFVKQKHPNEEYYFIEAVKLIGNSGD